MKSGQRGKDWDRLIIGSDWQGEANANLAEERKVGVEDVMEKIGLKAFAVGRADSAEGSRVSIENDQTATLLIPPAYKVKKTAPVTGYSGCICYLGDANILQRLRELVPKYDTDLKYAPPTPNVYLHKFLDIDQDFGEDGVQTVLASQFRGQ
ncbi:hypothetical protein MMC17_009852 [Xylographa soralifera]|nr:hypothetical protein [Xylographa soralifera]